jgi:hypothetical protein
MPHASQRMPEAPTTPHPGGLPHRTPHTTHDSCPHPCALPESRPPLPRKRKHSPAKPNWKAWSAICRPGSATSSRCWDRRATPCWKWTRRPHHELERQRGTHAGLERRRSRGPTHVRADRAARTPPPPMRRDWRPTSKPARPGPSTACWKWKPCTRMAPCSPSNCRSSPSPRTPRAASAGFGAFIRDISNRRAAERDALRLSQERYRAVIEHVNDGVVVIQHAGRWCSPTSAPRPSWPLAPPKSCARIFPSAASRRPGSRSNRHRKAHRRARRDARAASRQGTALAFRGQSPTSRGTGRRPR